MCCGWRLEGPGALARERGGGGLIVLITVNTNVEEIQIYAMLCKWLWKALEMPALFGM